jgi:short-subunit dehydrogenase involved in D-alanine esterification of teichoic acids
MFLQANLVMSKHGNVNILVNNAAVVSGFNVVDNESDKMLQTFNTNLLGCIWVRCALCDAHLT